MPERLQYSVPAAAAIRYREEKCRDSDAVRAVNFSVACRRNRNINSRDRKMHHFQRATKLKAAGPCRQAMAN
jgi:hypothetical protein